MSGIMSGLKASNAHIAHVSEPESAVCANQQTDDFSILRITLGFDPGISGAIVVLGDGEPRQFVDMPTHARPNGGNAIDAFRLAASIRGIQQRYRGAHIHACLEIPSTRPGESPTSGQRSGESYGILKGVLGTLGIHWCEVRPQTWKRHFGLIGTEKDVTRILATRRFPRVAQSLQRVKDGGRADALMIGLWAWQTEQHAEKPFELTPQKVKRK